MEGDEEGGDPDRVAEEDAPLCVSSPLAVVIPVPTPPPSPKAGVGAGPPGGLGEGGGVVQDFRLIRNDISDQLALFTL